MSSLLWLINMRNGAQQTLRLSCSQWQSAHILTNSAGFRVSSGILYSNQHGMQRQQQQQRCYYSSKFNRDISLGSEQRLKRYNVTGINAGINAGNCNIGNYNNRINVIVRLSTKSSVNCADKSDATKPPTTAAAPPTTTPSTDLFGETANLGLFAKFKHMYKKYWYVLIPVHLTTSLGWFGAFYYLSKCGVDVPSLLQYLHLSETIIEKVQNSDMGHYAVAYLCYKVATPLRYALTLGGTTISIKYLVQAGHIKPMPSKRELIKMYEDKKAVRTITRCDKSNNSVRECNQGNKNSSSTDQNKKSDK